VKDLGVIALVGGLFDEILQEDLQDDNPSLGVYERRDSSLRPRMGYIQNDT
jgi:hypothetical protein